MSRGHFTLNSRCACVLHGQILLECLTKTMRHPIAICCCCVLVSKYCILPSGGDGLMRASQED